MMRELTKSEQLWVDNTLDSLNLREKIGQTAVVHAARLALGDFSLERVSGYLSENPIGSIFLAGEVIKEAGRSTWAYQKIARVFQDASRLPVLVAGDLEHGVGSSVASMTMFPELMALGAACENELAYGLGKYTAIEGGSIGFNWTFSPVVDVLLNWQNPIVSYRSLGSNPKYVAGLAAEIIKGLQEHGLAACAKHFPGDGVDFRDQHVCTSVNSLPEEEWWQCHGKVFQAAIDAGVYTVMLGHIALPWLEEYDGEKNRYRPATLSRRIIDLLRNIMGFKGVIVSDALDMGGFVGWGGYEERILECFNSGTDVMLWPGKAYFDVMERAVNNGSVSTDKLNGSVHRILELKVRLGLLKTDGDRKGSPVAIKGSSSLDPEIVGSAKKLSRDIAAKSITLVRDRKKLLPLDNSRTKRILIGKMSRFTKDREYSIDCLLGKLKSRGIETAVLEDWDPVGMENTMDTLGHDWDAFLVPYILRIHGLTNTIRPVGESAMAIWCSQALEGLDPIVVSMSSPFLLNDMPHIDTLINTYSICPDSVDMLVKALFGEIPFSGRSPVDTGGW